jgi:sterol desaturase/sphingolipid hydroxylase (fatty acid hydroxylase superfamily)
MFNTVWFDVFVATFIVQTGIYLGIAGTSFVLIKIFAKKWFLEAGRANHIFDAKRVPIEFRWGMIGCVVNSLVVSSLFASPWLNKTKFYTHIDEKGWLWYLGTVVFLIMFQDTSFYWFHRLFHRPWFFKKIHSVHHLSLRPSPLAALSLHPIENMTYAATAVIVPFLIPIHFSAISVWAAISMLINALGHTGLEVFPQSWKQNPVLKWLNRPHFHYLHHTHFHGNFGFYFTFWDKLSGTFAEDKVHFDERNSKTNKNLDLLNEKNSSVG